MKFLIIGLGNFGKPLAVNLTAMGNEVIGTDINMDKVEALKDKITHTVCMDSTDANNLSSLPLKDMDAVIVAVGEDFAASILITAHLKQLNVKKLIGRSFNEVHHTVIEALGVDEILLPEQDAAERIAVRLTLPHVENLLEISENSAIIELRIPENYHHKTLSESGLLSKSYLKIIGYVQIKPSKHLWGHTRLIKEVLSEVLPEQVLQPNDHLLVMGNPQHLKKMLDT